MSSPPPPRPEDGATTGGGVGGAIVTIVLWILESVWQIQVPPHIASAITVIVVAICAWIGQRLRRSR